MAKKITPEMQAIRDRNMAIQRYIAAEIIKRMNGDQAWGEAWLRLVSERGRTYGLIKKAKPRGGDRKAGLLWEAWNHYRGQASAHALGVGPANMSIMGLMCSALGQANAMQAFEAAIDAITEAKLAMKRGEI